MKQVVFMSQKGGVGKTTLSIHSVVEATRNKLRALLVDLDPQANSAKWGDLRDESRPAVVSAHAERLEQVLTAAQKQAVDLAVIDTPATSETSSLSILRASDLVLVPCRPSTLDMHSIRTTIELARAVNKEPWVILTMTRSIGSSTDDAQAAIEAAYKAQVCPIRITNLVDYQNAVAAGKSAMEYNPFGKASEEIRELYLWIGQHLDLSPPVRRAVRDVSEQTAKTRSNKTTHLPVDVATHRGNN